jgi:hypothetical protein
MISPETLSAKWLKQASAQNKNADPILVEKVIRALLLLEGLAANQLNFIFKGGTALMLHLNSSRRLSIDIDIIMEEQIPLQSTFDAIAAEKGFTRAEEQERPAGYAIQKEHYKFYYSPIYKTAQSEEYVLLDILLEEKKYTRLISLPVDSVFVQQNGAPLTVNVPSINDLLGDKLTAFAPYTTGIPYTKGGVSRSMEIIKQLYDVGHLFDVADHPGTIGATFEKFALTELGYRALVRDSSIVLDDIYHTALHLCTRGKDGKGELEALERGLKQIKGYIFSESYTIEKAIVHASKAAYLSVLIRQKQSVVNRFSNPLEITDWNIEQPYYTRLNKLKKTNPEAFFYWYHIYLLERK